MTDLLIGSLFTGYGGLDRAVEEVTGGRTVWVSDNDKNASKVLAHHMPGTPNLGDITQVDWSAVEPVDILTGGFPCQDLSHAGKRAGISEGTRSGLWNHMAAAVEVIRPKMVVIENVRGILSAKAHSDVEHCEGCVGDAAGRPLRALGLVLADLAALGYDANWGGVRASDAGAPHGRMRVFIVATPGPGAVPGPVEAPVNTGPLLPTPVVNDMGANKTVQQWDEWTARMKEAHGNGNGHGKSLSIEALRLLPTPEASLSGSTPEQPLARKPGRTVVTSLNIVAEHMLPHGFGDYSDAVARWEDVLGRPAPQPTEINPRTGKPALSSLFVEWMMGLPQGHVTGVPDLSRLQQLKMLGNGVVPQQAQLALRMLGA